MGMFNWVDFKDVCLCGAKLEGFQTKDDTNDELLCIHVKPQTVAEFYVNCEACDKWYDYKVSDNKKKVARLTKYETIDLREIRLPAPKPEGQ